LDQIIVVGITGQQMTPLARIDDPLAIAKIKSQRSQPPASPFSGEKIARLLSMANLSAGKKTGKSAK
jgi:flagellar biogenesis protein FliO